MKRNITLVILITSTACLIAACIGLFAFQIRSFRRNFVADLSTVGEVVATDRTVVDSVVFKDKEPAEDALTALKARRDVVSATLLAKDGTAFAHFGEDDGPGILQTISTRRGICLL